MTAPEGRPVAEDDEHPDPADGGAGSDPGEQHRPGAWSDPRLPWAGKPRRVDILCWAMITLSGLYYWVLLPFRADLVGTHPVLLELLNGTTESIIAAAGFAAVGHGTLLVVMLAWIPGTMKFDIIYWWAGRLWGERVILMFSGRGERGAKYMARVQRWGRKFTFPAMILAPFLPLPSGIIYAVCGWAGMSWITFLLLDMTGELLFGGLMAGLGYELGHRAVVVAQDISHYGLWITLALVAFIVFTVVRQNRGLAPANIPVPPGTGVPGHSAAPAPPGPAPGAAGASGAEGGERH